jgi:hypothetical protein
MMPSLNEAAQHGSAKSCASGGQRRTVCSVYAADALTGFAVGVAQSRSSSATVTASRSAGFVDRMKSMSTETKRNGLSMYGKWPASAKTSSRLL